MTHQFITDAGHGWLQVPVSAVVDAINDGQGFSSCSYANLKTGYAYLEEDCDAPAYTQWYKDTHGAPLEYEVTHYDGDCFIRELPNLIDTRRG